MLIALNKHEKAVSPKEQHQGIGCCLVVIEEADGEGLVLDLPIGALGGQGTATKGLVKGICHAGLKWKTRGPVTAMDSSLQRQIRAFDQMSVVFYCLHTPFWLVSGG